MTPDKVYSVVVIGPMDNRPLNKLKKKVPVSDHIGNIHKAVLNCEAELRKTDPMLRLDVQTAHDISVDGITPAVMRMMDQADFAIADIAHDSPATNYEIATLHAMGIPTIFLDYNYSSGERRKGQFYLKDQLHLRVDDFFVAHITTALLDSIKGTIGKIDKGEAAPNPISQHYNTFPLIEASPVTGLAIGQFFNFVGPVIHENGAIVNSAGRYTKLVAIEPERLQDAGRVAAKLKDQVEAFQQGISLEAPAHHRGSVTVSTIQKTIVDFPTPLSAVAISPKYGVFINYQNMNALDGVERVERFERKLIRRYFNVLKRFAKREPGAIPDLFTSMTVDEVVAAAKRGDL